MKNLKRILSFFIVMGFMFVMFGFRVGLKADEHTVTYTVTATNAVSASGKTNGTTATYSQTYGTACQATNNNSFEIVVTFLQASTIKGITLSMHSNAKGGSGELSAKIDDDEPFWTIAEGQFKAQQWYGSWSSEYVDITSGSLNQAVPANSELTIHINATANSLFCQSYSITYDAELSKNPSVSIISPLNTNLMVGNTLQLESSYVDIDNPTPDVWSSSNTGAATVSNTGLVTPVSLGTTNITRTVNGTTSNSISLKIWPSNTSNISIATALAIAEFTGNTNSVYNYSSAGTVSSISGPNDFILSDGNDSITVHKSSHGLRSNDAVVVSGKLVKFSNTTLEYTNPTISGYTVTFDSNGGSPSYEALTNITGGSKISSPGTPTRDGYSFAGWYNGENPWDFANDKVNSFVTLTAHWVSDGVDDAINNQISTINAYMSLAYKYTFGSTPTTNTYIKATGVSQLSAGDTVVIVSLAKDGNYYAMTSSITSGKAAKSGALTITNDVITSEISSDFVWTLRGSAKDGWALKNGNIYLDNTNASSTNIETSESEAKVFKFVYNEDKASYYFLNKETRTMLYNGTDFKNYAVTGINTNSYATNTYIFVKQSSVNNTYRDVDFRLRIAVDDEVASVLSGLSLEGSWGIEVTAGDKTVKYECGEEYMQSIDGYKYVVVDLGDMLNVHYDKITTNFTARAYVLFNGNYYYSTKIKTYSIKSMLDNYYGDPATTSNVEGLVQALEGYGYTFSNE